MRSPQEINLVKKKIYENILPKLYKPQAKKKKRLFEKNNSIMIISPERLVYLFYELAIVYQPWDNQ